MARVYYCRDCGSDDAHLVIIEDSPEWSFHQCNACEDRDAEAEDCA